jgi:hypothetical protein
MVTVVYDEQTGGGKMNGTSHDAYRSAMNEAMDQLGLINEEGMSVRNRMEQLHLVLEALKPFLTAADDHRPISKLIESAVEPAPTPQTGIAVPSAVPPKMIESSDPIQRRINSVLGLAVA